MRVRIMGQYWNLRFVRSIKRNGDECYGWCDKAKREILIEKALTGQQLTDTIVHELFHAAGWNLDEAFVTQAATDIAAVLHHKTVHGKR